MNTPIQNPISARFNAMSWHDSKMLGLRIYKSNGEDHVWLHLDMEIKDGSRRETELTFEDCAYFSTDLYLLAKSMCADDVASADCVEQSAWKEKVSTPAPEDPIRGGRGFEEHLHFRIVLCRPGGVINILAKGFSATERRPQ